MPIWGVDADLSPDADLIYTYGYELCSFPTNLFLYSYETYFIPWLFKKNEKKIDRSFNFMFRYIDRIYILLSLK